MLYESDLNKLLGQWTERLDFQTAKQEYKDALRDCIYDVKCLVDKNLEEEALAKEAWEQQMADSYLSTIEAHDALLLS